MKIGYVIGLLLMPVAMWGQVGEARAIVDTLTSREMAGRGYEEEGHLVAARYIASRFRALGLDSLGEGYMHAFEFHHRGFAPAIFLELNGGRLAPGWEFLPAGRSGSGELTMETRIVFAGDGLVVPSAAIDAYRGLSPMGAVVVIDEVVAAPSVADTTIPRARLGKWERVEDAMKLGARAVIVLVDRLTFAGPHRETGVPVFEVHRSAMPADLSLVSFSIGRQPRDVITSNVVASLPGDGTTDSIVMIVGHYDHLGRLGDSVWFPGANDNASGIAMMIELARELRDRPLRYTVLFVAFSAEEAGLIGSRFFVENPPRDISRIRFLLNLDMTASGTDGLMALGGVEAPEEASLLRQVADSLGVKEVRTRANAPISDHFFFLDNGVRGFYLYPFVGAQPYHNVEDRGETLQWEVYERLRSVVVGFLRRL